MSQNDSMVQDNLLEQLIQKSPVPTFVIDRNHKVVYWNQACAKLTKVTESEVLGSNKQWKAFYRERKPVLADMIRVHL